jgi:Amt family ammonium transporter
MLRVTGNVRLGIAATLVAGAFFVLALAPAIATAQGAGDRADPSIEERIADLEAYVNNTGRAADAADAAVSSKISGAGPGHSCCS